MPKENEETTEIDVILITTKGIFVFESKNYSGWIFGDEKSKMWTQSLPAGRRRTRKNKFYNPILQNKMHIENLKRILEEEIPMFSIIAFSERCELKNVPNNTAEFRIMNRNYVGKVVENMYVKLPNVIEQEKVYEIYQKLYKYSQVTEEQKQKHIEDIKSKL